MDEVNPVAADDALSQLQQIQELAVAWVTKTLYDRHPELDRFNECDRRYCQKNVDYHLQLLAATLEFRKTQLFIDYIRWQTSVVEHRGFTPKHMHSCLRLIDDFINHQLMGAAARVVHKILEAGIEALICAEQDALPSFYQHVPASAPQFPPFILALIEGDHRTAKDIITRTLQTGMSPLTISTDIIQPALYGIGHAWQLNQISVAQEHSATALCQTLLAWLFTQAKPAAPKHRRALFACIEGNDHSLGLRIVAYAFEQQGWEVAYLGANTPTSALITHIRQAGPDLVGFSVALPQQLHVAKAAIEGCRRELGDRCPPLMIGGLILNAVDGLYKSLGADLYYPDAREAARKAAMG